MEAVGETVQQYMSCYGWGCSWTVMVSGWEKRQGLIQSIVSKSDKERPFTHSPSRNGCEVWGPQLHLVPALTDRLLAHALSPEDPPAACCCVLR